MNEKEYDSEQGLEELVKLVHLSTERQIDKASCEAIVKKAKIIYEKYPESEDIALGYAIILFNLSVKKPELNEPKATIDKLQALHEHFPNSRDIAEAFAKILFNLSLEQSELNEQDVAVDKLQALHEQYPDSRDIAEFFAKILVNLSVEQSELNEQEVAVDKLQALHEQFPDSRYIVESFAMILFNLSIKKTEVRESEATVEKVQKLHGDFPKSEIIAFIYGVFLASLFDHQTEVDERLQTTETIKKIYEQFSEFMLQIFDNLFFYNDNVCFSEEYKLFNIILKEGLLRDTKYAILKMWAERYKEDSNELENLLSIYQYVQKIKYQLGLKDEDKKENLKFGHYTKGSVLQSLLDQKEESNFSISGKTRLNNANYMNDPEEGIIIEKILGLDRRDIMAPSSWFLMSFTSKTDDLAMWSQYGDDAQGVCIVLREDDFSRFTSFNDVSWRQEKISLEFSDKMSLIKSELNSGIEKSMFQSEKDDSADTVNDEVTELNFEEKHSVSKGNVDYLYRIAYVSYTDNSFELEQTELFDSGEIEELKTSLNGLKEKLDENFNKEDEFYQKAISDCIEEIRYLFKSVDYKYENELRILRYANLDSKNTEIKIDKSSGMGKLYVERENPIQIGEVIFGPKFPNPEYVTPLLKLLDKNIVFKKSMIKFR